MKFLYFGDMHYRPTKPENRTDDFVQTQIEKTKEIIALGKKHKVEAFLQPGDLFDTPNPSTEFISKIGALWRDSNLQDLSHRMKKGDIPKEEIYDALENFIPMIGIVGNHELYGNNLNILPKTAINLMQSMGLIQFATKKNPFFIRKDGFTVAITGTHYHLDIDTPEHIDDYIVEEKLGDIHIHMVHGMLSDKPMGKHIVHTLVEDIAHTKADLTITGHDHLGFPLTEIDGKYFVNPGAVVRLSNDIKEIARTPKVLLIDASPSGLSIEEIPLKSAMKGSTVLSREKIIAKKKRESRLEDYKKAVRDAGIKESTDIIEIINNLAETKEISKEMKQDVLDRISEKKSALDKEDKPLGEKVTVERLVMENFQSHAYTELEFSDGLNIFVGESKNGKTAVLRALKWVYENKPAGKRIIRAGTDYARVTLYLSNDMIISRYIEAKASGKNGYEIFDPKTGETKFYNTKILPEVQHLLGIKPFVVDDDLKFNLNFHNQGDSWFLIGDAFSPSVRAKMIGAIYGTQHSDAVVRDLDSEERKINEQIKLATKEIEDYDKEMKKYEYLSDVEKAILSVEGLLKEVNELKAQKEKMEKAVQKCEKITTELSQMEELISGLAIIPDFQLELEKKKQSFVHAERIATAINKYAVTNQKLKNNQELRTQLAHMDQLKKIYHEAVQLATQRSSMEKHLSRYTEWHASLQEQLQVLNKTSDLIVLKSKQQEIQTLNAQMKAQREQLERVTKAEHKAKQLHAQLAENEKVIQDTATVVALKEVKEQLEGAYLQKERITHAYEQIKEKKEQLRHVQKEIAQHEQEQQAHVEEYRTMLEHAGTCPICFGTIDTITIERIIAKHSIEGEKVR